MDGIDLAAVDFSGNCPVQLAACERKWDQSLVSELHALCAPGHNEIDRAWAAGNAISEAFAAGVKELLNLAGLGPGDIRAIGSHGQTVRHRPEHGYSVQLGNGSLLAAMTGIDVVCDFRSADLSRRGQGAPLVPAFHKVVFSKEDTLRHILNIGGIANVSCLDPKNNVPIGFDTGPGNTLMDALCRKTWNIGYDKDGIKAALGKVDEQLLQAFMEHPYLAMPWPKSTGRETFTPEWTDVVINAQKRAIAPEDVLRTLASFTAKAAAEAIKKLSDSRYFEVYVCGGGAKNPLIMSCLSQELHGMHVGTTSELGADPDFVEAVAFAWLAMMFVTKRKCPLSAVTGASSDAILGCLYPA